MKNPGKKALEEFLNDEVEELSISSFYRWRERYYQVLPHKIIRKFGSREDQFIKYIFKQYTYGIRELSPEMIKKYNLTLDI